MPLKVDGNLDDMFEEWEKAMKDIEKTLESNPTAEAAIRDLGGDPSKIHTFNPLMNKEDAHAASESEEKRAAAIARDSEAKNLLDAIQKRLSS